jgi:hypothetical protein
MERQSYLSRASTALIAVMARQVAAAAAAMRDTYKPKGTPERLRKHRGMRSRWEGDRLRRARNIEPPIWQRDASLVHRHASRTV